MTILRQRSDTAANWTTNNPVVPAKQLCFDTTNNTFRIGDGVTNYESLSIQSGTVGNGIVDITGPTTIDLVDTYTINYTDLTSTTFEVTNGLDGVDGTISGNLSSDLNMNGFNIVNADFTGSITEQQVAMPALAIEPDNGTAQYKVISGSETWTDGLADGQSCTIVITGTATAAAAITFPTMKWASALPTLTDNDTLVFYKVNSILYGAHEVNVDA